jgi:predicted phage tail protein
MSNKRETKLPSLTTLESIKEALNVRLGRLGDPMDRGLTLRDLIGSNMPFNLRRLGSNSVGLEYSQPGVKHVPQTPTGFIAQPQFGGINLLWDVPPLAINLAYTEIYRSKTLSVESRQLVSVSGGYMYFDVLDTKDAETYHYWIRYMSTSGHVGPFAGPVSAKVIPLVSDVIERITGEIDESVLATSLNQRIDKIEPLGEGLGQLISEFEQEVIKRQNAIESLSQQTTTAQAALGEDVATVQQNITANVTRIDDKIVTLGASYTAQVQVNGLIGGFGIANDGTRVDAAFDVDRFWIGRTNAAKRKPFIIDGDVTYIDTAMIRSGTIQEGQLGAITIGKLKKNDGTPITTAAGLLRADAIDANELRVAEAATFTGFVSSSNWPYSGWALNPNGQFGLKSASGGGRVEQDGNGTRVYDQNGRLRVKMGRL